MHLISKLSDEELIKAYGEVLRNLKNEELLEVRNY